MDTDDLLKGLALLSAMKPDGAARDKVDDPIEDLAKSYLKKHEFQVGDRIVLKRGMAAMHKFPKPNQVCIVVDVLKEPIMPSFEKVFGTPHFMVPHDVRVAFKDPDGDFLYFFIDSRLFEPVKGGNVVSIKRK